MRLQRRAIPRPKIEVMNEQNFDDTRLWHTSLVRIREEFAALEPRQRLWIRERLAEAAGLQSRLHGFFEKASGLQQCTRCQGGCCGCGKNHFTLLNLLALLDAGEEVPEPDFSAPCPFLGSKGCALPPPRRPFNCVTFICDEIEDALCVEDRRDFYAAEKSLRAIYDAFDVRFAGSSLRGLLIRARNLRAQGFLSPP